MGKLPRGTPVLDGGLGRDDENDLGLLSLRAWEQPTGGDTQEALEIRSGDIHVGIGKLLTGS